MTKAQCDAIVECIRNIAKAIVSERNNKSDYAGMAEDHAVEEARELLRDAFKVDKE